MAVWHAAATSSDLGFWSSFLTDSFLPCRHTTINYRFDRLEKAGVDIGGMVVGYFRFGRVTRHRQPGRAGGTERRMR